MLTREGNLARTRGSVGHHRWRDEAREQEKSRERERAERNDGEGRGLGNRRRKVGLLLPVQEDDSLKDER